jgi:GH15 family glucan-1,4-alpha-glucosidase
LFGETNLGIGYETAANEIVHALRARLYRPELGRFARAVSPVNGGLEVDEKLDASLFGLWYFGAFAADDPLIVATMEAIEKGLWANTPVGGLARYTGDGYLRIVEDNAVAPGNPWFICTLWLAEYYLARGDAARAIGILEWVTERALPSGVLAEQVNPLTGAPVSVSPLTWSHSTFVAAVMSYLQKRDSRPAK